MIILGTLEFGCAGIVALSLFCSSGFQRLHLLSPVFFGAGGVDS